jgi:hypothetical protein
MKIRRIMASSRTSDACWMGNNGHRWGDNQKALRYAVERDNGAERNQAARHISSRS